MAYKVVKQKHFATKKYVFRIVNTGAKKTQVFGVNKYFDTEKQAKEYLSKGSYNKNF